MSFVAEQNYLWASLMVEELARLGVDYFCIAPGSRSTPLTVACAQNKKVKTFVHFDERALAFHALGYASSTKGGVAIITTSGSAVANLFPAVMEASKKKLPLLILTADRPPELRQTGANQTAEQVGIFGAYVRWQMDVPAPTETIAPEFILTTMDQAVFRSRGEWPGPVHLNCMFREPFLPETLESVQGPAGWMKSAEPFTKYTKAEPALTQTQARLLAKELKNVQKGLLAVGKLRSPEEEAAVLKLAEKLQWPIFADITSGLRWGKKHELIVTHFDQVLTHQQPKVDVLLQLGGRMTSKQFYQWLEQQTPQSYMMVLKHPLRHDPLHNVTSRVQASVTDFCQKLLPELPSRKETWAASLLALNTKVRQRYMFHFESEDALSETGVVYTLATHFPKGHALFLASSLPIREMDRFADSEESLDVSIGANRGVSGIDGTIASAIGYAQGLKQPVTLLIGDLAFLYDLNTLAMLAAVKYPLTIIVLNNDGGGIFNFLPIAQQKAVFEPYFAAPHHLSLVDAAKMFGLPFERPQNLSEFIQVLEKSSTAGHTTVIEVVVDREKNVKEQQLLQSLKVK